MHIAETVKKQVITTLTEVGLTIKLSDATIFGNMLQDALQKQHGLLGFGEIPAIRDLRNSD